MQSQRTRQLMSAIAAGLAGLVVFEGLPVVGVRFMEGHMAMWYLLCCWFPLVFFPATVMLTAVGQGASATRTFALLVSILLLIPESLLVSYRESRRFAKLWDVSDTLIVVGVFATMACVAGLLAPSVLRLLKRVRHAGSI